MKKVYKVTNWGAVALTSDNVSNKTHWLVKALNECLTLMDIGEFSFTYLTANSMRLITQYGNKDIYNISYSGYTNTTDYILYVDTENKELFGCCSLDIAFEARQANSTTQFAGQAIRGITSNGITTGGIAYAGGYLGLKIKNDKLIGSSFITNTSFMSNDNVNQPTLNTQGVVLADNFSVLNKPFESVKTRIQPAPIYYNFTDTKVLNSVTGTVCRWYGDYFTSIYITEKFYMGALKIKDDNTKWYYGGYIFDVDDRTDIGIIETTI